MSEDGPKTAPRRNFLNLAVGSTAAAFAVAATYPIARYIEPLPRNASGPIAIGKLEEFPLGTAKTVIVDDKPVLVIRAADGEFRAFSAICAHLQCIVGYSAERNQIECPCHRGIYSIDGLNIEGPPPRPLDALVVTVIEGSVIVSAA